MNVWLNTGARAFENILQTTWQATVLIALIVLVQATCCRRMSAGWRFSLWYLLVARLLMPAMPESSFSVFNLVRIRNEPVRQTAAIAAPELRVSPQPPMGGSGIVTSAPQASDMRPRTDSEQVLVPAVSGSAVASFGSKAATDSSQAVLRNRMASASASLWFISALVVWGAGAFLLALRLLAGTIWFHWQLRNRVPVTDPDILALFNSCRAALGVRQQITLLEIEKVETPAIHGVYYKRLLLPEGILNLLNHEELRHVFLHELAHVRRYDPEVNWLMSVLHLLHWFNPALWFAWRRIEIDRELAADALALSRGQVHDSRVYGETILKILEHATPNRALPGLIRIADTKRRLEHRLRALAGHGRSATWKWLAPVAAFAIGAVALTDAKDGVSSETGRSASDSVTSSSDPTMPSGTRARSSDSVGVPGASEIERVTSKTITLIGEITDRETGEPIPIAKVYPGLYVSSEDDHPVRWEWRMGKAVDRGNMHLEFDSTRIRNVPAEKGRWVFFAEAAGYVPQLSTVLSPGTHTIDFRLTRGRGPSGVVVTPKGRPVENAEVAVEGFGYLQLRGRRFEMDRDVIGWDAGFVQRTKYDQSHTRTDSEGKFHLPHLAPMPRIVAVHELGYASITGDELAKTGKLVLQPWGRVEGELKVGGEPAANQMVALSREHLVWDGLQYGFGFMAITDKNGRFTFTNAPPGTGKLVRFVPSPDKTLFSTDMTLVDVKPGVTTSVVMQSEDAR